MLNSIFRQNIKFFANLRGLNQAEIARHLGVSKAQVGSIFNGPSSPTLDTIEKICRILKIPPFFLILHDLESEETTQLIGEGYDSSTLEAARDALIMNRNARSLFELGASDKLAKAKKLSKESHSKMGTSSATKRK